MSKGKIAPIAKAYGDSINTLEQQLAKHNYHRAPGTAEMFLPYKETSGRYRTGLDTSAPYLNRLSEESRAAEIKRIEGDKARLEERLGVAGILNSNSIFYNFAATKNQLVNKFGSDLQVSPVKVGNKEEIFDLTDPMTEIAWNWIKVHPRVAPSLDSFKRGDVPSDVKYYIVDDKAEEKDKYNRKKEVNKATVAFEELPPSKKKQIARLMGLPVTEETTEETVYNLLDTTLKQTEFQSGVHKGFSPVRLFNELISTDDARIKIKDLVEQALLHSIYRNGMGEKITEGGQTIATSKAELIENLLKEENQMDVIALEKKLNIKKIEKA